MKCQHTFSKRLLTRAKKKTNFRKRDTLLFLTFSCKISISCKSNSIRPFFYFTGNGILHLKSIWKFVTFNPIRCFSFLRQGVSHLRNRVVTRRRTSNELSPLLKKETEEFHWNICLKTLLLCLMKYLALDGFNTQSFRWNLSGYCETSGWHFIATKGTSDSRKGWVLRNAKRNFFKSLI